MLRVIDIRFQGTPSVICLGLVGDGPFALIDCGPESGFEGAVAELRRLGLDPEKVAHLFVTHVHLDHAGAAWRWAEEFGTIVHAHPHGVKHLADPSKLAASASRLFGADMDRLWGRIRPVPGDRLRVIGNEEEFLVGVDQVQAIETLGHASHHHAYWLARDASLYAGDIAGVSIAGGPCVPPCPPPDINVEEWRASLARLRLLTTRRLVLTHGGEKAEPSAALAEVEATLVAWAEWVRQGLAAGIAEEALVPGFTRMVDAHLRESGLSEATVRAYEQADPAGMSVPGLARYWRKHRPKQL